ncbi:MAG TPA: hypothetical protein PKW95_08995, partial [bacterium]|nr:hypothetical protein [bacterium]
MIFSFVLSSPLHADLLRLCINIKTITIKARGARRIDASSPAGAAEWRTQRFRHPKGLVENEPFSPGAYETVDKCAFESRT